MHRDDTGDPGTVYDRHVSVEEDPQAENWWADDLTERINLRIPEWMWDDLEQHADYQQQQVSQVTRELLEYALMQVDFNDWKGINEYGRHTYGDVKCPSCAESHGLKLRWRRQREGFVIISCIECNARFLPEEGRSAETLPRPLSEIWYRYALNAEQDPETIVRQFGEFLDAPREFVEGVDWQSDQFTKSAGYLNRADDPATAEEEVYTHLEAWEAEQAEDDGGNDESE